MQRSWLTDVSPPSSISVSLDFQNNENNMMNSLVTSGDFSNVSFLLNAGLNSDNQNFQITTVPSFETSPHLMNFTFGVSEEGGENKTFTANIEDNQTFIAKPSSDHHTCESITGNDVTFTQFDPLNKTWCRPSIDSHELNRTITQSTPIHCSSDDDKLKNGKVSKNLRVLKIIIFLQSSNCI